MTWDKTKRLARIQAILDNPYPQGTSGLSETESVLARLAAHGWTLNEIAMQRGQTLNAVGGIVKRACRKLGCRKHELTRKMIGRIENILAD